MSKPELSKPPERHVYPRGAAPPPRPLPTLAQPRIPLWTRAVPRERSFPRV
jgi:hypothetical protein